MKRIVLIRHAKAEAPRAGLDDHERALTLEGRTSASDLATTLLDQGIAIQLALVSSAVRTQQTWKLMAGAFADAELRTVEALYETHVGGVHHELVGLDESVETVAVVGHEPTISATAAWLAGPGSSTKALQRVAHGLPTGTAAVLDFDGAWAALGHREAVLDCICHAGAEF